MLEASYRPSGWLGIMCARTLGAHSRARHAVVLRSRARRLTSAASCSRRLGSRLFYEFAGKALGDATSWERLADSVAVEVRRQSPTATEIAVPAATTAQATQGGAVVAAAAAAVPTPKPTTLSLSTKPQEHVVPASAAGGALPGVSVSLSNIVNNHNNSSNSSNSSSRLNNNSNNHHTSINNIMLI